MNDDYRRSVADTWNMTSLDKGELFLDLLETYAKQKLMFEEAGLEYEPFQSPLKEPWQKLKVGDQKRVKIGKQEDLIANYQDYFEGQGEE